MIALFIFLIYVFAKEPKSILIVVGKPSHGHGEHKFPSGADILERALNEAGLNLKASAHYESWPKEEQLQDIASLVVYAPETPTT